MNKGLSTVCASSLAFLALATSALACQGQNVLYEDDFSFADPAWGNSPQMRIDQGVLTLTPVPNGANSIQNQSGFFEGNLDVCVDVVQKVIDPANSWAALIFGGADVNNYYMAQVMGDGYMNVARLQKGRWLYPVPWTQTQGVVKPGNEVNQIRIVTVGNQVTGFVNGQQVWQFRAQLPKDGSLLGVYATSLPGKESFDFDNFKVTEASDAPPPAAPAPPPMAEAPAEPEAEAEPPAGGKPKPGAPGAPKVP